MASMLVLSVSHCEQASDSLRNWGIRERGEQIQDLSKEDIERLKRDLKLSEEKAVEFEKNLRGLLQEQSIQGDLAWKIGKAIMQQGRYEAADPYFRQAVEENSGPVLAAVRRVPVGRRVARGRVVRQGSKGSLPRQPRRWRRPEAGGTTQPRHSPIAEAWRARPSRPPARCRNPEYRPRRRRCRMHRPGGQRWRADRRR